MQPSALDSAFAAAEEPETERTAVDVKVGHYGPLPNVFGCEHPNLANVARKCPECGRSQTPKHVMLNRMLGGPSLHCMAYGGSRSGKTFTICRFICMRALVSPMSSHAIFRKTFNDIRRSIVAQTMPAVLEKCLPQGFYREVWLDHSNWCYVFPNGARIYLGGLADNAMTEKILGQEHATIYLNECSQISYKARMKAITRLAQRVNVIYPGHPCNHSPLRLKFLYDQNPPSTAHWTHDLFEKNIDPEGREALRQPEQYDRMRVNPGDNLPNLPDEYINLLDNMGESDRLRFLMGDYTPAVIGALWTHERIQREIAPTTDAEWERLIGRMQRITINVDPSGCSGDEDKRSDEIGITVTSRDHQGNGYLLDDASGHYSPEGWGGVVVGLYDKWNADCVVGETNYGGDMVRATVHAARRNVPFRKVTASRGKHVRAEPISALYGPRNVRIKHVGRFVDLENQLCNFAAAGYQGDRSPDRADSAIWGFTELFIDTKKGFTGQGHAVGLN